MTLGIGIRPQSGFLPNSAGGPGAQPHSLNGLTPPPNKRLDLTKRSSGRLGDVGGLALCRLGAATLEVAKARA